jgi:hypothetical protein
VTAVDDPHQASKAADAIGGLIDRTAVAEQVQDAVVIGTRNLLEARNIEKVGHAYLGSGRLSGFWVCSTDDAGVADRLAGPGAIVKSSRPAPHTFTEGTPARAGKFSRAPGAPRHRLPLKRMDWVTSVWKLFRRTEFSQSCARRRPKPDVTEDVRLFMGIATEQFSRLEMVGSMILQLAVVARFTPRTVLQPL